MTMRRWSLRFDQVGICSSSSAILRSEYAGSELSRRCFCWVGHCRWLDLLTNSQARTPRNPVIGAATVVDGDDIRIDGEQFRLNGINAVELKQRCEADCKIWACGADAKRALSSYLQTRNVTCWKIRRYFKNRWIASCEVDGQDIGEWLVREGWAIDDAQYSKGHYASAHEDAKVVKRGIWKGRFANPNQCGARHKWPPECRGIFDGCPIVPKQRPFRRSKG
jgi:endonuclease YncB( thermonuclease family)